MKNKKAQIQNMETITVVIIVMILIVIGIVYATNQKKASLTEERERTKDIEAMTTATNVLSMDFLKCTRGSATRETCIDYYKIKALNNNVFKEENYLHFYRLFGESKIEIKIIKNITGKENENRTIYSWEDTENKTSIIIKTPITIEDAVWNINYFGIMEVTAYR